MPLTTILAEGDELQIRVEVTDSLGNVQYFPGEAGDTEIVSQSDAVKLDVARVSSGYTLSAADTTAVNTSGGTDYNRFVPAVRELNTGAKSYWEVAFQRTAGGAANGYLGVVSQEQRNTWNADGNPVIGASVGYRGNGTLFQDSTQRVTGLPSYANGDVIMMVFEPFSGKFWVGKNGVWSNDPAGAPTFTTTPGVFYAQIQGRDQGDGGTLRSSLFQFSYAVPAGTSPLADAPELTPGFPEMSSIKVGTVMRNGIIYTDANQLRNIKAGTVMRNSTVYTDANQLRNIKVGVVLREQ